MPKRSAQAARRRVHHGLRPAGSRGRMSFKDWDVIKPVLQAEVRRSERLTAADYAVTINCRDDDVVGEGKSNE
jgi:hypothetical protein